MAVTTCYWLCPGFPNHCYRKQPMVHTKFYWLRFCFYYNFIATCHSPKIWKGFQFSFTKWFLHSMSQCFTIHSCFYLCFSWLWIIIAGRITNFPSFSGPNHPIYMIWCVLCLVPGIWKLERSGEGKGKGFRLDDEVQENRLQLVDKTSRLKIKAKDWKEFHPPTSSV